MDIWIIRDGEKSGPIHDYEIRNRIENGGIEPSTPAWHEGLPEWRPLSEIDLFRNEFEKKAKTEEQESLSPPPLPETPPAPQPVIRRFCARWLDLICFVALWWFAMWALGRDIRATFLNPWVTVLQYLPWFIIESILLHYTGTTPGKWLMGLRVHNADGSRLSLMEATRRSARVLVMGIGFGWPFLSIFCQLISLFTTRRLGEPLWDHAGGHRMTAAPLHPLRIAAFVILFVGAVNLLTIVLYPYLAEQTGKNFPAMRKHIEETPRWHLPPRNP